MNVDSYREAMTTSKPATDAAADRTSKAALIRTGKRIEGIEWLFELDEDPDFPLTSAESKEERRKAALMKGFLWHASVVMVDELFEDLAALAKGNDPEDTMVISTLPERYQDDYTALFVRKFLVTTVEVTARLTSGWTPLASTAQELAFNLLLASAAALPEQYGIDFEPGWTEILADSLFEDSDFGFLFDEVPLLGSEPPAQWFRPFNSTRHSSPYAEDL
ncbi:hypothetical protein A20C1_09574 [marine actinobacterium PHSC20C1]|nr:hypothetical protein A20C1_09574 [marine actinobacterium PHSC20C1]